MDDSNLEYIKTIEGEEHNEMVNTTNQAKCRKVSVIDTNEMQTELQSTVPMEIQNDITGSTTINPENIDTTSVIKPTNLEESLSKQPITVGQTFPSENVDTPNQVKCRKVSVVDTNEIQTKLQLNVPTEIQNDITGSSTVNPENIDRTSEIKPSDHEESLSRKPMNDSLRLRHIEIMFGEYSCSIPLTINFVILKLKLQSKTV